MENFSAVQPARALLWIEGRFQSNLTRAICAREIERFGRSWDFPPERFFTEPTPSGPNEGYFISREQLEQLLDWYYAARGWDANGLPTRKTLIGLGLEDEADRLVEEGVSLN
jgi:aldehyde:ferredoxin oxidoreductase